MNVLIDKFPTKVKIKNEFYELNTDFRVCLKIMLAFEDDELTYQEQIIVMLNLLYKEIPQDTEKACMAAVKFLDCCESTSEGERGISYRLFSWQKDAKYIYSAIKQAHGIDLEEIPYLHWWKFVYMFLDLNENCFFNRLVGLRDKQKKGKLTKEEREYVTRHKDIISLPVRLTPEEKVKIAQFKSLLGGGVDGI